MKKIVVLLALIMCFTYLVGCMETSKKSGPYEDQIIDDVKKSFFGQYWEKENETVPMYTNVKVEILLESLEGDKYVASGIINYDRAKTNGPGIIIGEWINTERSFKINYNYSNKNGWVKGICEKGYLQKSDFVTSE